MLLSAVNWTGNGGDNNWDTAANWDTNAVPTSADDVTINVSSDVDHSANVADSIKSLNSNFPLTISGGSLSIASASTIDNMLSITGGTLTGAGNLSASQLVTLTQGTLSGSGALNANGGMLIYSGGNSAGGYFFVDGRTINNAVNQTATWSGSGSNIQMSNGAVFNNHGNFDASGDGVLSDSGTGAASSFVNEGTFSKLDSFSPVQINAAFDVTGGVVDLETGSLLLSGGGSSTNGEFDIGTDATLEFDNVYTFDATTSISGAGALVQNAFTTLVLPGFNSGFTGPTQVYEGTLQVDGLMSSPVMIGSGNLTGGGTLGPIDAGAGTVHPGDSSGPGTLLVVGNVVFRDETTFDIALNGPDPGTGYSSISLSGEVHLGGSTLTGTVGVAPTSGESFTIIQGATAVVGTFLGLPEGGTVRLGAYLFTITYAGGGGHDVVLNPSGVVTPMVTSVTPSSGTTLGGTSVTITGSGFTGLTEVDFGASPATNVTLIDDNTITANSPPGSGVVDVRVTTPTGTSPVSAGDQFTYIAGAMPLVTSIFPGTGPSYGDTPVEIDGTGFTGATEVDFGTTAISGSQILVESDTAISVISPPGTGVVHVTVKTPAGTSAATPNDLFTYTQAAAPTVTSVSPSSGPEAGNIGVTITGTGFTAVTDVHFGTAPVSYQVVDDMTIMAAVPPGTGTVDVTVTTLAGTSPVTSADEFTYVAAAAPAVTGITPNHGPHSGGTSVTITGTGFTGATEVAFDSLAILTWNVVDDTTITATSPLGHGSVHVTVTAPTGTSATSPADLFTYDAPPSVPSVEGLTPTSGPASGGTTVTINGAGFTGATEVHFGTAAVSGVVVVSDSAITVSSPPGAGMVDVTVTGPGGTSQTNAADRFTFVAPASAPVVNGIAPNYGPQSGGTSVTITGTGFTGANDVHFGTFTASTFNLVNDTTITVVSPEGQGIVNVTVTTAAGTSATSASTQFTYAAPQVTPAPSVVSLMRFGFHEQPTSLVLRFSMPLDAASACDVNNYHIVTVGGRGVGGNDVGHVTRVAAAVYGPSTLSVTLFPAQRLNIHNAYRLTVAGTAARALKGTTGVPLAGVNGVSGTNYVRIVTGKLLAGPAPALQAKVRKRLNDAAHEQHPGAKAAAVHALALRSINRFVFGRNLLLSTQRRLDARIQNWPVNALFPRE